MKYLFFFFLIACASKPKVDSSYVILREQTMECLPAKTEKINYEPFNVMTQHPLCALLLRVYEKENVFFLDCTEEQAIRGTLVYTTSMNMCQKIKTKYLKSLKADVI